VLKALKRKKSLKEELMMITRLHVMYPSSLRVAKTLMKVAKRTTIPKMPLDKV
jgi:hypothetical protein